MPNENAPLEETSASASRPPCIALGLTFITLLFVAELTRGAWFGHGGWFLYRMLPASVGFLAVGLACGVLGTHYGRWILLGLIFCFGGDVFGSRAFEMSVVSFFLAHVAFIAAFVVRGIVWRRAGVAMVPVLAAATAAAIWVHPHVPDRLWLGILAYITIISLMVVFALGGRGGMMYRLAVLGAVIFYVSDIFVARGKFVGSGNLNTVFCYPLYYSACLLIAHSARYAGEWARTREEDQ